MSDTIKDTNSTRLGEHWRHPEGMEAEDLLARLQLDGVFGRWEDPQWVGTTPLTLERLRALLMALPPGEWRFAEVWVQDNGDPWARLYGHAPKLGVTMRHVETGAEARVERMGDLLALCDQVAAARFARVMHERAVAEAVAAYERRGAGHDPGDPGGDDPGDPDDPAGRRPRGWLPGDDEPDDGEPDAEPGMGGGGLA